MIINNIIYYNIISLCVLCITHSLSSPQQNNTNRKKYLKKENRLSAYKEKASENRLSSVEHDRYIQLMLDLGKYGEAKHYVKTCIDNHNKNVSYELDLARVLMREGKMRIAKKMFNTIIIKHVGEEHQVRSIINYFFKNRLFDKARYTIKEARKNQGKPLLYAFEMGELYYLVNDKKAMVQEYINYFSTFGESGTNYMKNVFQKKLEDKGDMDTLEIVLYEYTQRKPDSAIYADMLIWASLQKKDFYTAYIRSKAFDRRFKKEPLKILLVGDIALSNDDINNAEKAFSYVIKQYANTDNAFRAQKGLIKIKEKKLKKNGFIPRDSVLDLAQDYQLLIEKSPRKSTVYETIINQARLYAYRLGEKKIAIEKLSELIDGKDVPSFIRARAKMELGSIYVLIKKPWEAILLYAQLAHEQGETPIGYLAKLRSAKLYYYQGDFDLAQSQLDVLKESTTKKIANDAMELSLRIKENRTRDSTENSLKAYAGIELLLEGDQTDRALEALIQLKRACEERKKQGYQYDPIMDDVYFLEATIRLKRNEWEKAYQVLQKLSLHFGKDVLADDALFLQAKIVDDYQENKQQAMSAYLDFINRFPGSIYVEQARRRYRELNKKTHTEQRMQYN